VAEAIGNRCGARQGCRRSSSADIARVVPPASQHRTLDLVCHPDLFEAMHPHPIARVTLSGDGVTLAADVIGPDDGPRLLFLHGSGQTRQSWGATIAQAADRGYRAYAVDLRGHGDSQWAPDGDYDMERFVDDTRACIAQIGGRPAVIGASLGGLVGLRIAGSPPPALSALVLVDITPRIDMSGAGEVVAFMGSAPDGFASLDAAADAVAAYLPHRPRPKTSSGLLRNLRLHDDGRYHWHWDPAFLSLGRTAQRETPDTSMLDAAARATTIPTLLIRGGRSRLVSDENVREFLTLVPHAETIDIAGAHHMVAGDANDRFGEAAFDFLDRQLRPVPA
jgi:pimeloyl-ACP methyl ester carboxylesterase